MANVMELMTSWWCTATDTGNFANCCRKLSMVVKVSASLCPKSLHLQPFQGQLTCWPRHSFSQWQLQPLIQPCRAHKGPIIETNVSVLAQVASARMTPRILALCESRVSKSYLPSGPEAANCNALRMRSIDDVTCLRVCHLHLANGFPPMANDWTRQS